AAPAAETYALHQSILRGEIGLRRPQRDAGEHITRRLLGTAEPPVLRGRADSVAAIERFVAAGQGALLLMGEAGVGKTRLAVGRARRAASAGATVLAGAATEIGSGVPYAPLAEAWGDHLRDAPATENPFTTFVPKGAMQEDKLRLFQEVERSLDAMTEGGSVLLVIEDLHLADESTLHLFHHLARGARTHRWMLLATCREEETRADAPIHILLSSVFRERLVTRVLIDRLYRDACRQQIEDLLGEPASDQLVTSLYGLTEGNPFYTEEMVRASSSAIPDDLAGTIRARVARLGRDAELLLISASVVGQSFGFEAAQKATALSAEAALDALERCL